MKISSLAILGLLGLTDAYATLHLAEDENAHRRGFHMSDYDRADHDRLLTDYDDDNNHKRKDKDKNRGHKRKEIDDEKDRKRKDKYKDDDKGRKRKDKDNYHARALSDYRDRSYEDKDDNKNHKRKDNSDDKDFKRKDRDDDMGHNQNNKANDKYHGRALSVRILTRTMIKYTFAHKSLSSIVPKCDYFRVIVTPVPHCVYCGDHAASTSGTIHTMSLLRCCATSNTALYVGTPIALSPHCSVFISPLDKTLELLESLGLRPDGELGLV
ncbi:unnamed protein product [Choristocarpus tenellus]